MTPEISVVVPVYKGVRFLREALESVRAQTFADWECICVDDGSTDGSGALLDEIAVTDPRIRAFHRPNGGTSAARNFGLGQARGRYVAFLDEDDVYHRRMLETLHDVSEKTGADVVGCEFVKFAEDAHPNWPSGRTEETEWRVAATPTAVRDWAASYYEGIPFEVWRNLYRREVVVGHEFPKGVRVEQDLYWQYTLLPRVRSYVRIPWAGYAWRANSIGGFLHPDPESLISLTRTDRVVYETMSGALGMSAAQLSRLTEQMSRFLYWCLWRPLHNGVRADPAQIDRLREGVRDLERLGIDLSRELGFVPRARWHLFLLTGRLGWVRSSRAARRERR